MRVLSAVQYQYTERDTAEGVINVTICESGESHHWFEKNIDNCEKSTTKNIEMSALKVFAGMRSK
jgi:hypothetical protein